MLEVQGLVVAEHIAKALLQKKMRQNCDKNVKICMQCFILLQKLNYRNGKDFAPNWKNACVDAVPAGYRDDIGAIQMDNIAHAGRFSNSYFLPFQG